MKSKERELSCIYIWAGVSKAFLTPEAKLAFTQLRKAFIEALASPSRHIRI